MPQQGRLAVLLVINRFLQDPEQRSSVLQAATGETDRAFQRTMAMARDLGAESYGLTLVPVYERPGVWTAKPTERVCALALAAEAKRNYSAWLRDSRVMRTFAVSGPISTFIARSVAANFSNVQQIVDQITSQSSAPDVCIARIDQKIALGVL